MSGQTKYRHVSLSPEIIREKDFFIAQWGDSIFCRRVVVEQFGKILKSLHINYMIYVEQDHIKRYYYKLNRAGH